MTEHKAISLKGMHKEDRENLVLLLLEQHRGYIKVTGMKATIRGRDLVPIALDIDYEYLKVQSKAPLETCQDDTEVAGCKPERRVLT